MSDQPTTDTPTTPEPVCHTFQPYVDVTLRPDGRYDLVIDWSDAYLGVHDPKAGDHDPHHPDGEAACDAVDAWAKTTPLSFIIAPAVAEPTA